jgi:superfamily II DNA helicase RecQ
MATGDRSSGFHGEDVIVDVGTGSRKTLCFSVPLLHETDIVIVVSPLTALMIDQVNPIIEKHTHQACF